MLIRFHNQIRKKYYWRFATLIVRDRLNALAQNRKIYSQPNVKGRWLKSQNMTSYDKITNERPILPLVNYSVYRAWHLIGYSIVWRHNLLRDFNHLPFFFLSVISSTFGWINYFRPPNKEAAFSVSKNSGQMFHYLAELFRLKCYFLLIEFGQTL